MKIEHIGYAVRSIEKALKEFEKFGYEKITEVIVDEIQRVKICFIQKDGVKIELIEPIDEQSPINGILKKVGPTAYHVCYTVENFEERVSKLEKEYITLVKPVKASAFNGKKIAFFYSGEIGVFEIVEF